MELFLYIYFSFLYIYATYSTVLMLCLMHWSSLRPTQLPLMCVEAGNITLRCQYDGVENVTDVLWVIGFQTAFNASTIPGHTALPPTSTYQEVVVDSYTNLTTGYCCEPSFHNGSRLRSNTSIPQIERECQPNQTTHMHLFYIIHHVCRSTCLPIAIYSSHKLRSK